MAHEGRIVRWEAARGFGFIRSPGSAQEVFVHLRDFQGRGAAPRVGMSVCFELVQVGGKGPRAVAVRAAGAAAALPSRARPAAGTARARASRGADAGRPALSGWWVLAYGVLLLALVAMGRLPGAVLVALLALNALTFAVYAIDKRAAQAGRWRTAENSLHGLALAGGWPGAWCAQRWLRHKSSKPSFQAAYRASVLLHVVGLLVWVGWGATALAAR
jgi:uncharacterized membrane protein YsdA (DUF1294 family)/cold shock CspA family protein